MNTDTVTTGGKTLKRDPLRSLVGRRLHEARIKSGITQADAAKHANKSIGWLSEIEQGRSNIYLGSLSQLAKLYAFPIEYFVSDGSLPSAFRQPESLADWVAIFKGDEDRGEAHFVFDRSFMRHRD
jgi:transcriptional regulator with XRE-family HTH domain